MEFMTEIFIIYLQKKTSQKGKISKKNLAYKIACFQDGTLNISEVNT